MLHQLVPNAARARPHEPDDDAVVGARQAVCPVDVLIADVETGQAISDDADDEAVDVLDLGRPSVRTAPLPPLAARATGAGHAGTNWSRDRYNFRQLATNAPYNEHVYNS